MALLKKRRKLELIEYGVIKAKQHFESFPLRLKEIYQRLEQVIQRANPDESAFETIFYSKNVSVFDQADSCPRRGYTCLGDAG